LETVIIQNVFSYNLNGEEVVPADHSIFIAAKAISQGKLVAFPTETVYGLGASALDAGAVKKIYEVKGRPVDNPLIVHVHDKDMIPSLVTEITPNAKLLMDNFMPGPITLIFKKNSIIPDEITAGLDTVAIRIPSHKTALLFLEAAGLPVAAPSANISGKPSPTSLKHVIADLSGKVDFIIDGGYCEVGVESTVVDTTGNYPIILRPGFITKAQIDSVCGKKPPANNIFHNLDSHLEIQDVNPPRSPGMKYRHYAPQAAVFTEESGDFKRQIKIAKEYISKAFAEGKIIGIFSSTDFKAEIEKDFDNEDLEKMHFISFGSEGDIKSALSYLFYALRKMDELQVDYIFAQSFQGEGLEIAYMNRLLKASGKE